jgi:hypothetical protein
VNQNLVLALLILLALVLLDWILGIFISLIQGTFSLQKLPAQLANMVLPYLGGSGIVVILQSWAQQFVASSTAGGSLPTISTVAAYGAVVTVAVKVLADILTKFGALTTTATPKTTTVVVKTVPPGTPTYPGTPIA